MERRPLKTPEKATDDKKVKDTDKKIDSRKGVPAARPGSDSKMNKEVPSKTIGRQVTPNRNETPKPTASRPSVSRPGTSKTVPPKSAGGPAPPTRKVPPRTAKSEGPPQTAKSSKKGTSEPKKAKKAIPKIKIPSLDESPMPTVPIKAASEKNPDIVVDSKVIVPTKTFFEEYQEQKTKELELLRIKIGKRIGLSNKPSVPYFLGTPISKPTIKPDSQSKVKVKESISDQVKVKTDQVTKSDKEKETKVSKTLVGKAKSSHGVQVSKKISPELLENSKQVTTTKSGNTQKVASGSKIKPSQPSVISSAVDSYDHLHNHNPIFKYVFDEEHSVSRTANSSRHLIGGKEIGKPTEEMLYQALEKAKKSLDKTKPKEKSANVKRTGPKGGIGNDKKNPVVNTVASSKVGSLNVDKPPKKSGSAAKRLGLEPRPKTGVTGVTHTIKTEVPEKKFVASASSGVTTPMDWQNEEFGILVKKKSSVGQKLRKPKARRGDELPPPNIPSNGNTMSALKHKYIIEINTIQDVPACFPPNVEFVFKGQKSAIKPKTSVKASKVIVPNPSKSAGKETPKPPKKSAPRPPPASGMVFYQATPKSGAKKSVSAVAKKSVSAGPKKYVSAGPRKSVSAGPKKSVSAGPKKSVSSGPKKSVSAGPKKSVSSGAKKSVSAGAKKFLPAGSKKSTKSVKKSTGAAGLKKTKTYRMKPKKKITPFKANPMPKFPDPLKKKKKKGPISLEDMTATEWMEAMKSPQYNPLLRIPDDFDSPWPAV